MKKHRTKYEHSTVKRALAGILALAVVFTTPAAIRAYETVKKGDAQENPQIEIPETQMDRLGGGLVQSIECLGEDKTAVGSSTARTSEKTSGTDSGNGAQLRAIRPVYAEAAFDDKSVDIASILDRQMNNYLSDNTREQSAEVTTYRKKNGMNSSITFDFIKNYYMTFPISNSDYEASNRIMRWVNTAISDYPSLCTMHSTISYTYTVDDDNKRYLASIIIYSPLEAGDIKTVTKDYQAKLASLIKVPQNDTSMKAAERILYVHDKIVTMADYGTGDSMEEYIPAGVLLNHKGVCQSYAYVMNQALVSLGIESLFLVSDTHAWNAVKQNKKWYYVDATWDDPIGNVPISFVRHTYMLSNPSVFTEDHTMTAEYQNIYGAILDSTGKEFDKYLPKIQDSNGRYYNRAFDYMQGTWYVSDRIHIYTWDGSSDKTSQFTDIPAGNPEVCAAVKDGELYYSTPDGIFKYNKDGEDACLVTGNVTGFVFRGADMDYQIDGNPPISAATPTPFVVTPVPTATVWEEPPLFQTATPAPTEIAVSTATVAPTETVVSTSTPGATGDASASAAPTNSYTGEPNITVLPLITETPGASQNVVDTPDPTQTPAASPTGTPIVSKTERPGKGAVSKLSNYASKKIRVVVKKVKNAVGYQIWYSTDKKFKKNVKKQSMQTLKCVVKKLKKKTYYVKVRAYVKDTSGKRVYGSFSSVKKIRVKK